VKKVWVGLVKGAYLFVIVNQFGSVLFGIKNRFFLIFFNGSLFFVKRPSIMKRRKKRCPWCRKTFVPHPRLGDRQITCGDLDCVKKQRYKEHRRWVRKNLDMNL